MNKRKRKIKHSATLNIAKPKQKQGSRVIVKKEVLEVPVMVTENSENGA